MKKYQKPEVEFISLVMQEEITVSTINDDLIDGEMDLTSSFFD